MPSFFERQPVTYFWTGPKRLAAIARVVALLVVERIVVVNTPAISLSADGGKYCIADIRGILSPSIVIFRERVEANLGQMLHIAGGPSRLRPHCKTHKTREIIALQLAAGITKHKCATFAEAEMLAACGVQDIFLAYSLVGPNIERAVTFRQRWPDVQLCVTADHLAPLAALADAMHAANTTVEVLFDLDTGQHRTGLPPGEAALNVCRAMIETPGVTPGGLHLYDGQNHQTDLAERTAAVKKVWAETLAFQDRLTPLGWTSKRIVAGGTGSFPIFATLGEDAAEAGESDTGESKTGGLELSPGTCIYHDVGYGQMFPDLAFTPAALILSRVISQPVGNRITLDLGYKAVASDPPAGHRLAFPDLPDAQEVLQNEEHLVLETSNADAFQPGDALLAIPRHICPTSALHKSAYVIEGGQLVGEWQIAARDRVLTI